MALLPDGYALRRETAADAAFLERLYCSIRPDEFECAGWTDLALSAFLSAQFAFQKRHYAEAYPGADFTIVERAGVPAGRLYLFRAERDHHVIDISILPEVRNQGIGGLLLATVLAEAEALGKTVTLNVERFNRAQRLYRRLGFREAGEEDGPYLRMEWNG